MRQWCRENNNPDPKFEHRGGAFVTIFYKNEGLNEGLNSLLVFIKKNPNIQAKQCSQLLDRPIKTIDRQIKELKDKNFIKRVGSRKIGGYRIK